MARSVQVQCVVTQGVVKSDGADATAASQAISSTVRPICFVLKVLAPSHKFHLSSL